MIRLLVLAVLLLLITIVPHNAHSENQPAPPPISSVTQQLIAAIDDGETNTVMNILEKLAFLQNKTE